MEKTSSKWVTMLSVTVLMTGIFLSCKHKTGDESSVPDMVTDSVSAEIEEETGKKVTGVLLDATMNTVVLVTDRRDTVSFATGGAQMVTPEEGMMIGDTLIVTYEGDLNDRSSFPIAVAKKVVVHTGIHER